MWTEGVEGWVVPSEVCTGRAGGERDVYAVVDEDGNGKGCDERAGQLDHLGGRAIFPPDLNHRSTAAAGDRAEADSHRIPPLEQDGIGDHHQAQLIGERHEQDPARPARSHHRGREHE